MGRRRTCLCDACPKCLRRAAYHRRLGRSVDLHPAPPADDEPRQRTAAGHVPLTAVERAALRDRIDAATRRRIAASRELPIEPGVKVRRRYTRQ